MKMTRNDFMEFFRDEDSLNTLSPDDRVEVFQTILLGSSDFSAELLEDILADYSVTHLMVIDLNKDYEILREDNEDTNDF